MTLTLNVHDLVAYTDWLRREWQVWFQQEGPSALVVTTGPHGDGRVETVGALIRHIFSAELRYAERINGLPLTDTTSIASDDVDTLFRLGHAGRTQMVKLIDTFPEGRWDVPLEFPLMNSTVRLSPRKIVFHVLTHELRHWAQVGTLLRLQGRKPVSQDLLFSPILGDTIRM